MHASWLAFFLDSTALDSPPVWKTYPSKLPVLTWDCLVSAGLGSDPASWLD